MNIHETILEEFFFQYVDRGAPITATPLYLHVHQGPILTRKIARRFAVTLPQARRALAVAFEEVRL